MRMYIIGLAIAVVGLVAANQVQAFGSGHSSGDARYAEGSTVIIN